MKVLGHLLLTWFLLIGGSVFILVSPWLILKHRRLLELVEENPYLAISLDTRDLLASILSLMIFGVAAMLVGVYLRHGADRIPGKPPR